MILQVSNGKQADIRSENDLVHNQFPDSTPLLRVAQSRFDPLLLNGADDASLRVEILGQVLDIVDIVAQVGDIAIPLPRVQSVYVEEITEPEVPPNLALSGQVHLSYRDPFEIGPLGVDSAIRETDGVVRICTTACLDRVVRIRGPGFPVVVSSLVVVPNSNNGQVLV